MRPCYLLHPPLPPPLLPGPYDAWGRLLRRAGKLGMTQNREAEIAGHRRSASIILARVQDQAAISLQRPPGNALALTPFMIDRNRGKLAVAPSGRRMRCDIDPWKPIVEIQRARFETLRGSGTG